MSWIPSFFHFPLQLIVLLSCYALHLTVLSQHAWALPIEIVDGLSSVGYDSIVGMLVAGGYGVARIRQRRRANHNHHVLPWKLPMDGDDHNENDDAAVTNDPEPSSTKNGNTKTATTTTVAKRNIPWPLIRFRVTFVTAAALLVKTYFQTGRLSLFWEDLLYEQSAAGWPLTAARMRSLQVLLGHLSWVAAGTMILWLVPRPPSFLASFRAGAKPTRKQHNQQQHDQQNNQLQQRPRQDQKYHWFRVVAPWSSPSCHWLWWTLGGYLVSSWLFNVADTVNQIILPAQVLRDAAQAESVVAQLVRPEYNDLAALLAGYIAPCVSAPLWEELLYRGFLLAGLHAVTRSFGMAAFVQALVFSAHHMSVTGALPLAVLGGAWAVLYAHSRNLWTVVAVHALWNSRVFLGSWLGL